FAFANWHMARLLDLHRLLLVARLAGLDGSDGFQLCPFGFRAVHAVAARARHISRRVHPALEVGVRATGMAAKTGRVAVARRNRRDPFDPGLVTCVDMRLAGTMARFTALIRFRSRCTGVLRLAVDRRVQRLALSVMAGRTRVVADEAAGLRRWRSYRRRGAFRRPPRRGGEGSAAARGP